MASAEALQAETQARGQARAVAIAAESEAARAKIAAQGEAEATLVNLFGPLRRPLARRRLLELRRVAAPNGAGARPPANTAACIIQTGRSPPT